MSRCLDGCVCVMSVCLPHFVCPALPCSSAESTIETRIQALQRQKHLLAEQVLPGEEEGDEERGEQEQEQEEGS